MKHLVGQEEANILFELGFKEDTIFAFANSGKTIHKVSFSQKGCFVDWDKYDEELRRPTYNDVFEWFRINHKIYANFMWSNKWCSWRIDTEQELALEHEVFELCATNYNSNCLKALIEIFKKKQSN